MIPLAFVTWPCYTVAVDFNESCRKENNYDEYLA